MMGSIALIVLHVSVTGLPAIACWIPFSGFWAFSRGVATSVGNAFMFADGPQMMTDAMHRAAY